MNKQLHDQQNIVLTITLSKIEISLYKVYNSFQSQFSVAVRHKILSILKTQLIWKGMVQSLLIQVTFTGVHLSHIIFMLIFQVFCYMVGIELFVGADVITVSLLCLGVNIFIQF